MPWWAGVMGGLSCLCLIVLLVVDFLRQRKCKRGKHEYRTWSRDGRPLVQCPNCGEVEFIGDGPSGCLDVFEDDYDALA